MTYVEYTTALEQAYALMSDGDWRKLFWLLIDRIPKDARERVRLDKDINSFHMPHRILVGVAQHRGVTIDSCQDEIDAQLDVLCREFPEVYMAIATARLRGTNVIG
jgi:hypothetical protein